MKDDNFAIVDGKRYPLKYEGVTRGSYKHLPGCLAFNNPTSCCQCGALSRAIKIFSCEVPPKANGQMEGAKDE